MSARLVVERAERAVREGGRVQALARTMQARMLDLSPLRVRPVGPAVSPPLPPSLPVIKLQSFRLRRGVADRSVNNGGIYRTRTPRWPRALQTYIVLCTEDDFTMLGLDSPRSRSPCPPFLSRREIISLISHKQNVKTIADVRPRGEAHSFSGQH